MATIVTSFSFAVRETQSLGQQMLKEPLGINGLSCAPPHAEKYILNPVKSNQIWIVITISWLIWYQMESRLVPYQSEKRCSFSRPTHWRLSSSCAIDHCSICRWGKAEYIVQFIFNAIQYRLHVVGLLRSHSLFLIKNKK